MRRAAVVIVLVAGALALPAATSSASETPHAPTPPPSGYADPLSALGATSPSCRGALTPAARRNCAGSGSIAHRYPLNSYGLDVQVGFSLTHMDQSLLGALQSLAALLWMGLVFVVKAVLLLLEWAFSVDLLGTAMPDLRRTLVTLHERVVGEPWLLTALSATALWGIWRGLVQRQTVRTISALAASVG